MANTTWNPADLLNCTLSGANLIATTSAAGGVRGKDALTSGKYYWEYAYTTLNTNSISTGIALASASLSLATGTGAAYVLRSTGGIMVNGVGSGSSLGIVNTGSVLCFAVDFTGKLLWVRNGAAGNWNGSGTANPATAAGGVNIASISTGLLFPLMSGASADKVTANFGDSAFTGTVPSGFTAGFPVGGGATAQARVMVMA